MSVISRTQTLLFAQKIVRWCHRVAWQYIGRGLDNLLEVQYHISPAELYKEFEELPSTPPDFCEGGKIGRNVEATRKGNILTITVDLSERLGDTASGKSVSVATTGGNVMVEGDEGFKLGLNCYVPKPRK
jgi:hypothetical protein